GDPGVGAHHRLVRALSQPGRSSVRRQIALRDALRLRRAYRASRMTLVVCDVDGTLVDKQKRLSEATVAAVTRLRAHGFGFTLISARPMSGMMALAERLGLDVP